MVDSGSSMDLISNNLVQRLGLPTKQKQKIMLWSINRKEVATQGRWITPGTLGALGVNLAKHSFYVAPTGQFEAIVGLPWLQKMALSINWARGLLLLRNSWETPARLQQALFLQTLEYPQNTQIMQTYLTRKQQMYCQHIRNGTIISY